MIREAEAAAAGKRFEMSASEVQRYSLRNALLAVVAPNMRHEASFEMSIAGRAVAEGAAPERDGIFIPFAALSRDLVVGTPTAGGNLVANELKGFIDILRPASRVVAAGATVMTDLRGNLSIPRVNSTATVSWVGENTAGTESQPAFDQVQLTPKEVTGFVDISRRLVLQSSADVQSLVQRDLFAVIGTALDQAAIAGSGSSNQPRGILNTAGIGTVAGGTNGAVPSIDNLVDLETAVANANTIEQRMAYLTNTRVRGRLQRSQMFAGTNGMQVWQRSDSGEDRLNGRPAYVSNNVPNTLTKGTSNGVCSAILYGNWVDLLIGIWGAGITLLVDPYTQSTTGAVRLVVMLDCDVALRYPTSFSAMLDALTT